MSRTQRTVLVTGASNGIGLSITKYLLEKGYDVIATDKAKIDFNLIEKYPNLYFIKMDVTNESSILLAKSLVEERYGKIDALVNNVGIFVGGPLVELDFNLLKKIFEVNVFGTALVTRTFYSLISKSKGKIIIISSEAGRFTPPFSGPYSMTKYAIESFSDALRRELMFAGISVSTIQPGAVKTHLLKKTPTYYEKLDASLFSKQIAKINRLSSKEWAVAMEPNSVAKLVYRVLNKRNPKPRYRIKNNLGRRILELLPTKLVDKIIFLILK